MRKNIQDLVNLQAISDDIATLEERKKRIPANYNKHKNAFDKAKLAYDTLQTDIEQNRHTIKANEEKIEQFKAEIKSIREKEKFIKTQKEFEALDAEQQHRKDKIDKLEKENKAILETVGKLELETIDNQAIMEDEQSAMDTEAKRIEKKLERINKELEQLYEKKEGMTQEIEDKILEEFYYTAKMRNGQGIVAIENGICMGCNIALPPQQANAVRKGEDLVRCPNCARFVYHKSLVRS